MTRRALPVDVALALADLVAGTPVKVDGGHAPGILLIGETLDAATPYIGSLTRRGEFPNSALVEGVGGPTHSGSPNGIAYVDNTIADYLTTGVLPARVPGDRSDRQCDAVPQPVPDGLAGAAAPAPEAASPRVIAGEATGSAPGPGSLTPDPAPADPGRAPGHRWCGRFTRTRRHVQGVRSEHIGDDLRRSRTHRGHRTSVRGPRRPTGRARVVGSPAAAGGRAGRAVAHPGRDPRPRGPGDGGRGGRRRVRIRRGAGPRPADAAFGRQLAAAQGVLAPTGDGLLQSRGRGGVRRRVEPVRIVAARPGRRRSGRRTLARRGGRARHSRGSSRCARRGRCAGPRRACRRPRRAGARRGPIRARRRRGRRGLRFRRDRRARGHVDGDNDHRRRDRRSPARYDGRAGCRCARRGVVARAAPGRHGCRGPAGLRVVAGPRTVHRAASGVAGPGPGRGRSRRARTGPPTLPVAAVALAFTVTSVAARWPSAAPSAAPWADGSLLVHFRLPPTRDEQLRSGNRPRRT